MKIYEVTPKDPTAINISPKTEAEEIIQNVRTILATQKARSHWIVNLAWTVPLSTYPSTWLRQDLPMTFSRPSSAMNRAYRLSVLTLPGMYPAKSFLRW